MKKKSTPGIGFAFLQKMIQEELAPVEVEELGVRPDFFTEDEKLVFEYYESHWDMYGAAPSVATVEVATDHRFGIIRALETFEFYVDRLRERFVRRQAHSLREHLDSLSGTKDVDEIRAAIDQTSLTLGEIQPSKGIDDITTGFQEVFERYQRRARSGRISGVRFGMPFLDTETDGAQPGDLISVVGRTRIGKTYFLLSWALAAYLGDPIKEISGKSVFFLSMEMERLAAFNRLLGLYSRMDPDEIRKGRIPSFAVDRINQAYDTIRADDGTYFKIMSGGMVASTLQVARSISMYRPDVVYIDGAYLLQADQSLRSTWERVFSTVNFLKMLAEREGIPIICSYQFNKRGAGRLENIAFSDTIGMTSSIVIGLDDYQDDSDDRTPRRKAELLKGREGEEGAISVLYDIKRGLIQQDRVIWPDIPDDGDADTIEGEARAGRPIKKHARRTRSTTRRHPERN